MKRGRGRRGKELCKEERGRVLSMTITLTSSHPHTLTSSHAHTPIPTQVELKKTKRVYAMKVIKKSLVMDEEVSSHPSGPVSSSPHCGGIR